MSVPAVPEVDPMLRAAVLKVAAAEAEKAAKVAAADCGDVFAASHTSQARPRLPDGTEIATIFTTGGGPGQISVLDREAFTAWVAAEFPDETYLAVTRAFEEQLLREVRKRGEPVTGAGEVIPGLGRTAGRGTGVTVKPRDDAAEQVGRAWRAGLLPPLAALLYPDGGQPALDAPGDSDGTGEEGDRPAGGAEQAG